jgi:diaminopimelate decarboxylase
MIPTMVSKIVSRNFSVSDGELVVSGIPISSLTNKYGTPAFVYDRHCIDAKLDGLRGALPSRFNIYYSVKANPNLAVLSHFLHRGCGLEIASEGEFYRALQAGCPAEKILFAGPGKTERELETVLSRGIGEIHMESLTEAKRISTISRRLDIRAKVALRVNPAGEAEGGAMRMGGRAAPFGIDEESLDDVLNVVLADAGLDFRGLHIFAGTQNLDAASLASQYRHGLKIAKRVVHRMGHPLQTLDFGGGLGIPYFPQETELDLARLRTELEALFSPLENDPDFEGTQFLVEPGRFLVGEAGIYVAKINDIKVSRGKKFLIVDGGMNHHLSASGNLGQTIKRNFPVALLNKLDAAGEEPVDVVGPLCTPLDTLVRGASLPHAEIGDLFGIFQSGAYARSASPLEFLSHRAPPEIWVDEGQELLITARGGLSEEEYDLSIATRAK